MAKALQNKKWVYYSDCFDINKNSSELEDRLNQKYTDPQKYDVISATIFKNGNHYSGLIIYRELREINQKRR